MGARIRIQTKVWSTGGLVRAVKPGMIFLNLHRGCENPNSPFEALRAAQLIPFGALLISEHACAQDERAFSGIVQFETVDNLGPLYQNLSRLSTDARARRALAAADLYVKRFAPYSIFANAGVYELLDNRLAGIV